MGCRMWPADAPACVESVNSTFGLALIGLAVASILLRGVT